MLKNLFTSWALFCGLFLIMVGNGLLGVIIGLRANNAEFGTISIGLLMGGYFLGLFLGALFVPKIVSNVGHIRTFGALSAIASSAALLHIINQDPIFWTLIRILTGFTYSGIYIVVESWLNEKSNNKNRGQILSFYMIISMGGFGIGQILGGFENETDNFLFILVSILVSIAVVPMLITASKAPDFSAPESLTFKRLYHISPLGLIGMLFNGLTISMTNGMGIIYAINIGMSPLQSSIFLASLNIGNLILQYPIGKLSDILDRRVVILIVSFMAFLITGIAFFYSSNFLVLFFLMGLYGGFSHTIYSLCIAHTNDYLPPKQMVGASSTLITINGIGAILGSPIIALFMSYFGNLSFFFIISLTFLTFTIFIIIRIFIRKSIPNEAQGNFVAVPESSTAIATPLNPETEWDKREKNANEDEYLENPYYLKKD